MCGITGFIDFTRNSNLQNLKDMTETLFHRGPDGGDYQLFEKDFASIGLGHRRLSIIDLHESAGQPMSFKDWVIVFNGEIYNFQEIRRELIAKGRNFSTLSDTEVILQSFDEWGHQAVDKFIGMFVFAIYNQSAEKLYIYRDRAGVKPLYYYHLDGLFLFSSELKAFHAHPRFDKVINNHAIAQFLQFGYILAPDTIFRHAHKLNAGHYLEIDVQNLTLVQHEYWNIAEFYNKPKLDLSKSEAQAHTKALLKSACEYRMVSDVPVGVFLSGGYDSSLVTAILQTERTEKLKTFTIGFEEKKYDESNHAKRVASYLGTNHVTQICSIQDAKEKILEIPDYYDEPFSDPSAIPTMLVSELARKDVTVALSADAGDELFGGYSKYQYVLNTIPKLAKIPIEIRKSIAGLLEKIDPNKVPYFNSTYNFKTRFSKGISLLKSRDTKEAQVNIAKYFSDEEISALFVHQANSNKSKFVNIGIIEEFEDAISAMLCADFKTYMVEDILTKVDRATMRVGLEGREPLLDHRLAEWVAQLPNEFKITQKGQKILLKEITHTYIPKEIMDRPKMGFGIPLVEWFQSEIRDYIHQFLSKDYIEKQGIFNFKTISQVIADFERNNSQNVFKLWNLLMFQLWYARWVK